MKFSTRHEADLPAEQLFQSITNFDRLDRLLRQRGASVSRTAAGDATGVGTSWKIGFDWRGKAREMTLQVVKIAPPQHLVMQGQSEALDLTLVFGVEAIGPTRSRLISEAEVRPRNVRARLMLQTAKLGKSRLDQQFDRNVVKLVEQLISAPA